MIPPADKVAAVLAEQTEKRARDPWKGRHPGTKPCKIKLKARKRRRRKLAGAAMRKTRNRK